MTEPRPKAIHHRFTAAEWAELDAARHTQGFPSVTAYVVATALKRARAGAPTVAPPVDWLNARPVWGDNLACVHVAPPDNSWPPETDPTCIELSQIAGFRVWVSGGKYYGDTAGSPPEISLYIEHQTIRRPEDTEWVSGWICAVYCKSKPAYASPPCKSPVDALSDARRQVIWYDWRITQGTSTDEEAT